MSKHKSSTVRAPAPKKSQQLAPPKSKNNLAKFSAVSPLPMQYLGSKTRISRWLLNNISEKLPDANTFVDLFSGTGAVAFEAASRGYEVVTNDLQPYSYAILKSVFKTPKAGLSDLIPKIEALRQPSALLKGKRAKLREFLALEDDFIECLGKKKFEWKQYKKFCDSTPRLEDNAELRDKKNSQGWHLFSWYYPNSYFGIRQCLEIDTLREFADGLKADEKAHVLAAVISALTFTVSSTTHLAQYIKPNNAKQAEFILRKRLKSIIDPVIDRLKKLEKATNFNGREAYNLDFLEALKKMNSDSSVVVYADPPYFKEHYSRYYHVLDTFYLYDYPEVTLNPQTNKLTEGKYRNNRSISDFGLRSKVASAFEQMLISCAEKKFSVAISYANTSLIDATEMKQIIKKSGFKSFLHWKKTSCIPLRGNRVIRSLKNSCTFLPPKMKKRLKSKTASSRLRQALIKQTPQHDTPIGVLHPYWARKPLNIVTTIIETLSKPSDVVFDPFVGSGTVAYSALISKRKAVASDLNPLSIFISKTIFELPSLNEGEIKFVQNFYTEICEKIGAWYIYDDLNMVERSRYEVCGEFKDGAFELKIKEIVLKKKKGSTWAGRQVKSVTKSPLSFVKKYLNHPIRFEAIPLQENSRIAIPKGAKLSHFFDEPNRAAINFIYSEIGNLLTEERVKNALYFILSSSMPLLRLSDKKATSQWPYWRPKNSLTSRNPCFVIKSRVKDFVSAAKWAKEIYPNRPNLPIADLIDEETREGFCLFRCAAQNVSKRGLLPETVDLILTDPPYADQVPYLEYSELWNRIILGQAGGMDYMDEIVKTDAPSRKKDDGAYIDRLCEAFEECCKTLKKGGHFVFFYQDRNLEHWARIYKTLTAQSLTVLDVIPLPKQRRSMKSVTSPGRTFDGDLLIVAQKQKSRNSNAVKMRSIRDKPSTNFSFFEKYAYMIRNGLVHGQIERMAKDSTDVFSIIDKAA